jgi:hypothetical protein
MAVPIDTRPSPTREVLPVERRAWWTPAAIFGPGRILGALGAAGVAVSCFLSWRGPGIHPDRIPLAFLWDRTTGSTDPSLLIALIPIGVVLALGAFVPLGVMLRFVGGLAMLVVAGVFAYQLNRVTGSARGGSDLGDVLGSGFYAGAIGGVLAFLGGLLPSRAFTTQRVV